MPDRPSQQLAERFHLNLPADLQAWFDDDGPQRLAGFEFSDGLSVQQIIDPQPGDLWGGFMPPDTLPVLGNRYGDWICLRLDEQGEVRDWICWRHGGGDWTIIGETFCEALIYECVSSIAHGKATRPTTAATWALGQLQEDGPLQTTELFADDPATRLHALLDWRGSPAAQRDLALLALDCPFRQLATPLIAEQMSIEWDPDFLRLTFDTSLITPSQAAEIEHRLDSLDDAQAHLFQQDWNAAEQAALATLNQTEQLGWAFDIAGWAAERRGDLDQAIQLYRRALKCSAFSDESVLFRTHWFSSQHGKFCAARLAAHNESPGDAYSRLVVQGAAGIYEQVAAHWSALAELAEQRGDFADAVQLYWNAGWDIGFIPLDRLPGLMDAMIRAADAAGADALREVIKLHRKFVWKSDH